MAVVKGQCVAGVGARPGIGLHPQWLLSSCRSGTLLPLWVRAFLAGAQQLAPGGEAVPASHIPTPAWGAAGERWGVEGLPPRGPAFHPPSL